MWVGRLLVERVVAQRDSIRRRGRARARAELLVEVASPGEAEGPGSAWWLGALTGAPIGWRRRRPIDGCRGLSGS